MVENSKSQQTNPITTLVTRYRDNPVLFVKEVLRAEPEEEQVMMLNSVRDNRMTAVKAGHGVGKTTALSWIILWFMFTRPYPKIPCTAPTLHQLRDILWAEISKWLNKSELLTHFFNWTVERLSLKTHEEKWFAVARTATQPDAMQGFHADSLLFVIDEASGVKDQIFEPVLGALTGQETRFIMVGNPTKTSGFFYNAFTENRTMFNCFTLNAENSKRVSFDFIESILKLYGKDSDPYRVRVLGEFPKSQPDTFIALSLVEDSIKKYKETNIDDSQIINASLGVDVARFGDDESVIYLTLEYKDGLYISKMEDVLYTNTTVELTGHVKMAIANLNARFPNIYVSVNVDGGGVGAGVVDELESNHGDLNYTVIEQTFGGTGGTLTDEPIRYSSNTGLLWGNVRRLLLEHKLLIEDDGELIKQLTVRKYTVNEDGFIQLERKQDMKKRNEGSPDRADALSLSLGSNIAHFGGMLDY